MTREEKQKLEKKRADSRRYYQLNKEKCKARSRAWAKANPERALEHTRAWQKANPEKVRETNRKQREKRKTDRTKMASVLLAKTLSAKKRLTRTLENNLTTEYIQQLLEKQNFRCAFTGIELDHVAGKNSLRLASIDRKNSNRGYVKGNVQIVLNCLNKAKGESTDKEFRMLLAEIKKCKVS